MAEFLLPKNSKVQIGNTYTVVAEQKRTLKIYRYNSINLGYFIKCTNLCSQIEIYLENDLPLVVKYDVASLGSIKLCLSVLPSS